MFVKITRYSAVLELFRSVDLILYYLPLAKGSRNLIRISGRPKGCADHGCTLVSVKV